MDQIRELRTQFSETKNQISEIKKGQSELQTKTDKALFQCKIEYLNRGTFTKTTLLVLTLFTPTTMAELYERCPNKKTEPLMENIPWKKSDIPTVERVVNVGRRGKETIQKQSFFYKELDEKRKEKASVQPYISSLLEELLSHYNAKKDPLDKIKNIPIDKHKNPSVGTRKPDIVHYRANQPRSIINIIALGEVKGRRNGEDFINEEKGQILSMVQELARKQPFREKFFFYLTDSKNIQFFMVRFNRKVIADEFVLGFVFMIYSFFRTLPCQLLN